MKHVIVPNRLREIRKNVPKSRTLRVTFVQIEFLVTKNSLCLKIAEKVAFDIASEASYVYILSRQKFIKNAKNGQFGEFMKINWKTQM